MGKIGIIITLCIFICLFLTWDVGYRKVKGDLGSVVSHPPRMFCDCGFICLLPLPAMKHKQYKSRNFISDLFCQLQVLPVTTMLSCCQLHCLQNSLHCFIQSKNWSMLRLLLKPYLLFLKSFIKFVNARVSWWKDFVTLPGSCHILSTLPVTPCCQEQL